MLIRGKGKKQKISKRGEKEKKGGKKGEKNAIKLRSIDGLHNDCD